MGYNMNTTMNTQLNKKELERLEKARARRRRWTMANPEKMRASWTKYNKAHADNIRKWHKENPLKVKAYKRKWALANPDKIRAKDKEWKKINLDKVRMWSARYKKNNPDKD